MKEHQSTGKYDKNGVEVYKGSLLSVINNNYGIINEPYIVELSEYPDSSQDTDRMHCGWNLNSMPLVDCLDDGSVVIIAVTG